MEPNPRSPAWIELAQLVPVVVLASSFVVGGEVDLARATPLFVVAAALSVPILGLVAWRRFVPNWIAVGADLWLWLGAAAFAIPIRPIAAWLAETHAVGIFVGAFAVGVAATFGSPGGYVGLVHPDRRWVRRTSVRLLALTGVAIVWAWLLRDDLRLGGGLPFIVVNVARRWALSRVG
ncbi:MAG: hypothetical protein ABMB14_14265 [Myxococcota bacterium]